MIFSSQHCACYFVGFRLRTDLALELSDAPVSSSCFTHVGNGTVRFGRTEPVPSHHLGDSDLVRNARARAVPLGVATAECVIAADFAVYGCSATHVCVGLHDRGATYAR